MILQVLFYAERENFVLKCKFNSKSLALPVKISGCATVLALYVKFSTGFGANQIVNFDGKVQTRLGFFLF